MVGLFLISHDNPNQRPGLLAKNESLQIFVTCNFTFGALRFLVIVQNSLYHYDDTLDHLTAMVKAAFVTLGGLAALGGRVIVSRYTHHRYTHHRYTADIDSHAEC